MGNVCREEEGNPGKGISYEGFSSFSGHELIDIPPIAWSHPFCELSGTFPHNKISVWTPMPTAYACLDLIERHIPTKLAKVRNGLPWVNQNLKQAIRRRDRAWFQWKMSHSRTAHSRYLGLKQYVHRSFRAAYWNYINDLICLPNDDGKPQGQKWFWSYIKSLLGC